ncbi:hypothetical protein [Desulfitobacterium hafniense]|uniref:hypothetical protein n=1 Tax=Desulfitobacterium hafniense TaxID=49338 RepID=UPI0002F53241|nr:hypothetical protein [Desulfitobacterium hafniense]MEA5023002.1 hypothetical protein [Desulfitobacterium hafniense]
MAEPEAAVEPGLAGPAGIGVFVELDKKDKRDTCWGTEHVPEDSRFESGDSRLEY